MKYINEEIKFWKHSYQVYLSEFTDVLVNADCEQDALDFAIDHALEQGWDGLFLDEKERQEIEAEGFLEDYICGGNESKYLSSFNVSIIELD